MDSWPTCKCILWCRVRADLGKHRHSGNSPPQCIHPGRIGTGSRCNLGKEGINLNSAIGHYSFGHCLLGPCPLGPCPPPPPLTLRTYTSESPVVQFACSSVQTWLRVAQRDLLFAEGSRVAGPTFTNFLQNSAKIGQIGALPPAWPLPCGWPPHIGPGSCTSPPGSPTSCSVPPRTFPSRGCACRSDIACICANSFFV